MKIKDLLDSYSGLNFQAGRLARAAEIWKEMKGSKIVLTLAGALVPCGLRKDISKIIRAGYADIVVSTGANLTHDLASAFGETYEKTKGQKDEDLRKQGKSRIYDVISRDESSIKFEKNIQKILKGIPEEKRRKMATFDLIREIGAGIKDKDSIVRSAYDMGVPVYVPALEDSILGFQAWMFSQDNVLNIDHFLDLKDILDRMFDYRSSRKKTGVVILGGGVPKNYALQAAHFSDKPYDYAVQITLDRVETGGLSGASLDEAISWGKLHPKTRRVTVCSEVSLVLPILAKYLTGK